MPFLLSLHTSITAFLHTSFLLPIRSFSSVHISLLLLPLRSLLFFFSTTTFPGAQRSQFVVQGTKKKKKECQFLSHTRLRPLLLTKAMWEIDRSSPPPLPSTASFPSSSSSPPRGYLWAFMQKFRSKRHLSVLLLLLKELLRRIMT